jgi:hypothetical protein
LVDRELSDHLFDRGQLVVRLQLARTVAANPPAVDRP